MSRRAVTLAWGSALAVLAAAACTGGDGGSSSGGTGGSAAARGGAGGSGTGGGGGKGGSKSSGGTSGSSAAGAAGEGASAALCPALVPCGGDPDGEWTARAGCVTDLDPMMEPGCEGAVTRKVALEGSYTFYGETHQLLVDIVLTQTVVLDVDNRCAQSIANGAATAAFACPYLEEQYADSPQYDSVSCELVAPDLCHCELVGPAQPQNVLNTYTVSGNQLLDAQGDAVDFCVDDDSLGIYYLDTQSNMGLTMWFDRAN
jgi:hypothetical protein